MQLQAGQTFLISSLHSTMTVHLSVWISKIPYRMWSVDGELLFHEAGEQHYVTSDINSTG